MLSAIGAEMAILYRGFLDIATLNVVGATVVGCVGGIVVGAIPGLTATMAMALLVGLTYGAHGYVALGALIGIYVGGVYGGSVSAILMNVPGTPSNAATAIDGHALVRRGEAGQALGVATISSFVGEFAGELCTLLLVPVIAYLALKFSSWDLFLVSIYGVLICGSLTDQTNPVKGWITGWIGLLIGMVGIDGIWGQPRFTFGVPELVSGIDLVPALVGMYGIAEVLDSSVSSKGVHIHRQVSRILPPLSIFRDNIKTLVRSVLIGVGIGVVPGVGESISSWVAYDAAKRNSKNPEELGKGSYEGIIASESSNNATSGGALVPMLTLGIPGSPCTAILLAALLMHGFRPGPMLRVDNPELIYSTVFLFWLSAVVMLVAGLLLVRPLIKILSIKSELVMPIVAVFCAIGSYASKLSRFDLLLMLGFGLLGYIMRRLKFPVPPMILGIILGNLVDVSFRRAMMLGSQKTLGYLFASPISLVLIVLVAVTIWKTLASGRKEARRAAAHGHSN